jgi:hypothetical protein
MKTLSAYRRAVAGQDNVTVYVGEKGQVLIQSPLADHVLR